MRPLFEPDGAGFLPAPFARGPWDEGMMHGGAPAALLARAIEATQPGSDLVVTRLTIDLLGGVPLGHVDIAASLARSGRRFQVADATLAAGGRAACLARAVRVRRGSLPEAEAAPLGGPAPRLAPPQAGTPLVPFVAGEREYFYPDACEISHVAGELGSGAVAAWIRLRGDLLPGESPSQLARRRGGRLRERPELDPPDRPLAVRQHGAHDPPGARAARRVDRARRADDVVAGRLRPGDGDAARPRRSDRRVRAVAVRRAALMASRGRGSGAAREFEGRSEPDPLAGEAIRLAGAAA